MFGCVIYGPGPGWSMQALVLRVQDDSPQGGVVDTKQLAGQYAKTPNVLAGPCASDSAARDRRRWTVAAVAIVYEGQLKSVRTKGMKMAYESLSVSTQASALMHGRTDIHNGAEPVRA